MHGAISECLKQMAVQALTLLQIKCVDDVYMVRLEAKQDENARRVHVRGVHGLERALIALIDRADRSRLSPQCFVKKFSWFIS